MKRAIIVVLTLVISVGVVWAAKGWAMKRLDNKAAKFNTLADNLILGIQQYREFVGSYPAGNNIGIAKALLGQTDKRVLILAVRKSDLNDKGEILDSWGTPLQFYFSHTEVMIRSAGPNQVWEDSAVHISDDLYRCARTEK